VPKLPARPRRKGNGMPPTVCFVSRRLLKCSRAVVMVISMTPALALMSAAQDVSATSDSAQRDRHEQKSYVEQNGTQKLTQTLETEHHVTSDGEVDIQRYRAPAWEGDDRVTWESEVRTRKLPDGTVEKEYVVRNPDGAGHLAAARITREKITADGDSTVVHREVLGRLGSEDWQPIQKEKIVESGPSDAKQVIKEVQRLDTVDGHWQTNERETSATSASTVGEKTQTETNSVRQSAEPYGKFRDVERRQEKTVSAGGKETHESTVYRLDTTTTESDRYLLVDHTTKEVNTVAPGNTTEHLVRESDLLFGNYQRNMESRHPEVAEEQTTAKKTAPDGSRQTVTEISGRSAADPSTVRPLYKAAEESDSAGYVRRIYIPAQ